MLVHGQPELNWRNVPADVLNEVWNRVNLQLQAEDIPEVTYDLFSWRIARTIQYRTCKSHNPLEWLGLTSISQ